MSATHSYMLKARPCPSGSSRTNLCGPGFMTQWTQTTFVCVTYISIHPFAFANILGLVQWKRLAANSPFSGSTQVSRYQKGNTNLDFTEARDSEWQWHQLGNMQVYTLLQTDNHASTPPLNFLQAGCPSCRPTNSVKALNSNIRLRLLSCILSFEWHIYLAYIHICHTL